MRSTSFAAPVLAGLLGLLCLLVRWRGVDLPAQLYRVTMFHRHGFALWDSQWYGGHWTLSYSVLFPPVAGVLGVPLTEIVSAVVASWAFDRLAVRHFGSAGRAGSVVFAVWTLAQLAIGQLPFLLGEALALTALLAASRRRWWLAAALGVASALTSPLSAAFLMIALAAWFVTSPPRRRLALVAVILAPAAIVIGLSVTFPGDGSMPFEAWKCAAIVACAVGAWLVVPSEQRSVRVGLLIYATAVLGSFLVSSPVGDNITRLAACVGAPLMVCLLWRRSKLLLAAALIPLALFQWIPTIDAIFSSTNRSAAAHREYYEPLNGFLRSHALPAGRVEVVPTRMKWEAAYVAPVVPLARGWERQLDTANNPQFYEPQRLTPTTYDRWLLDNGVRYVALPDTRLDYAARHEAALLREGVPGLRQVWSNAHWKVFEVEGATGIVDGPANLRHLSGGDAVLAMTAPGVVTVRVRYSNRWSVADGDACVRPASDGWLEVVDNSPGQVRLHLGLSADPKSAC